MNNIKRFSNFKVNETIKILSKKELDESDERNAFKHKYKNSKIKDLLTNYNSILQSTPINIYEEETGRIVYKLNNISDLSPLYTNINGVGGISNDGIIDGVNISFENHGRVSFGTNTFKGHFLRGYEIDSTGFHTLLDILSGALNVIDIDSTKVERVMRNTINNIRPLIQKDEYSKLEGKTERKKR